MSLFARKHNCPFCRCADGLPATNQSPPILMPQMFDCHYNGDINACDKDCKTLGACKRRTGAPESKKMSGELARAVREEIEWALKFPETEAFLDVWWGALPSDQVEWAHRSHIRADESVPIPKRGSHD
jgi:hypothetical protein